MTNDQIDNIFTYHKPFGTQQDRYVAIREKAKELAFLLNDACPESREKSLAFTQLQSAIHWANSSIAINEREALTENVQMVDGNTAVFNGGILVGITNRQEK